jgi:uncharacterized protein
MTEPEYGARKGRISSLDLIRGVAVLGILAINIGGFAGPGLETISPNHLGRVSPADEWTFAAGFLVFEGKMRTLFTLLFGASMVLFIERSEAQGEPGITLQLRRLLWLGLFGYLHFLLFWWGDILFLYALAGLIALPFCRLRPALLAGAGLSILALWTVFGIAASLPAVVVEERIRDGAASAAEIAADMKLTRQLAELTESEAAGARAGFIEHVRIKLEHQAVEPVERAIGWMGETLPLILIGMALYRGGFFSGGWSRRALRGTALLGVLLGGAITLAMLGWTMPRHFPPRTMGLLSHYGATLPHLLMALGYAAALVLAASRLRATRLGIRIVAAGKMAFSNYLGTTVVMTALFNGWGLGLFDRFGPLEQVPFVLLGWALMLALSKPWLARYRRGPVEWLWRSLVEWRILPNRC